MFRNLRQDLESVELLSFFTPKKKKKGILQVGSSTNVESILPREFRYVENKVNENSDKVKRQVFVKK